VACFCFIFKLVWERGSNRALLNFKFKKIYYFIFLYHFDMLILKFKKKHYFYIFINKKNILNPNHNYKPTLKSITILLQFSLLNHIRERYPKGSILSSFLGFHLSGGAFPCNQF